MPRRIAAAGSPDAILAANSPQAKVDALKPGEAVIIIDSAGNVLDAIFGNVDFIGRSGFRSYRVLVKQPCAQSKSGRKTITWYIPATRFAC